jgi:hypothetical protein
MEIKEYELQVFYTEAMSKIIKAKNLDQLTEIQDLVNSKAKEFNENNNCLLIELQTNIFCKEALYLTQN